MIYLSIGRRELGKTTLVYWMARRLPARLIFDPRGMVRLGTTVTNAAQLEMAAGELIDGDRAEVVFTPFGEVQHGFERFAAVARNWIVEFPGRPLAIVVDEVSFVRTDTTAFQWILRCSARSVVHVFLTAHRPSDIATSIRAIADHWLLFQMRQEHDLKVLDERCSETVLRSIEKLQPRQFVHWDDSRGLGKVYPDPGAWYVNLDPHGHRYDGPAVLALDELPAGSVETPPVEREGIDPRKLFS